MWILISIIFILIILFLSVCIWYNPHIMLDPLNLLYTFDLSPRTKLYTKEEPDPIFPVSTELETIWEQIRQEGYELYDMIPNKEYNYLDNYHMNIGYETKKDWTTIPLRLFGRDFPEYMETCPLLENILRNHPEIKSCLYSIMQPGKIIQPHHGPYDGLLRYQLALDIPPTDEEHECYLHVGDEKYQWNEGKGVMFDESNIHGAVNTTDQRRMVLLIDLERPYSFPLFRLLNKGIIWGM